MVQVVLGIGSNQGNRMRWLEQMIEQTERCLGQVILQSRVVESEPWGYRSGKMFLNQVVVVLTEWSPQDGLRHIHEIEAGFGRVRTGEYTDRNADIDILFYGSEILDLPGLSVPHPRLADRLFVLMPLADVLPDFIDPVSGLSVQELLNQCKDTGHCHWYQPD